MKPLPDQFEPITLPGVCVRVFGLGVLLLGPSGSGKTETALELVCRGHSFVADDQVVVTRQDKKISATAPQTLFGFAHVRDVGIVSIQTLFGTDSVIKACSLDVLVSLSVEKSSHQPVLGDVVPTQEILGVALPHYEFFSATARSLPLLVEIVAKTTANLRHGQDVSFDFLKNHVKLLQNSR
jgi:HPr kinase/phosphorylase